MVIALSCRLRKCTLVSLKSTNCFFPYACPVRLTCTKTWNSSAWSTYLHTNGSKINNSHMMTLFPATNTTFCTKDLLLQEMVDNIPEDKKWECPECASVKIERRKVAVERARLKRAAQGRALVRSAMHCSSHFSIVPSVLPSIQRVPKRKLVCPKYKVVSYFGPALLLIPAWKRHCLMAPHPCLHPSPESVELDTL